MLGPPFLYTHFAQDARTEVTVALFFAGFIGAWVWWSINVSRWRRWALRRGLDADALQAEGESSSLLWPKGHFFERSEFDRLMNRRGGHDV